MTYEPKISKVYSNSHHFLDVFERGKVWAILKTEKSKRERKRIEKRRRKEEDYFLNKIGRGRMKRKKRCKSRPVISLKFV
jgi:hypothetical protein